MSGLLLLLASCNWARVLPTSPVAPATSSGCDRGHKKELQQRGKHLRDALDKVVKYCGPYAAAAAAAIAAARAAFVAAAPYLEFAGEAALAF
jgi:hypothetical protein